MSVLNDNSKLAIITSELTLFRKDYRGYFVSGTNGGDLNVTLFNALISDAFTDGYPFDYIQIDFFNVGNPFVMKVAGNELSQDFEILCNKRIIFDDILSTTRYTDLSFSAALSGGGTSSFGWAATVSLMRSFV